MQQDVLDALGSKALYQLAAQYGGQTSRLNEATQSALLKAASSEIENVFKVMSYQDMDRKKGEEVRDRKKREVSSLISLHINQAGAGESWRQENVDRAKRAVSLNYGSHDSIMPRPDLVDLYQQRATYNIAGTLSNTVVGLVSGVDRRMEQEALMDEDGNYDIDKLIEYSNESESRSIDGGSYTPGAARWRP